MRGDFLLFTIVSLIPIQSRGTQQNVKTGEDVKQMKFTQIADTSINGTTSLENLLAVYTLNDLPIPLLGISPTKSHTHVYPKT